MTGMHCRERRGRFGQYSVACSLFPFPATSICKTLENPESRVTLPAMKKALTIAMTAVFALAAFSGCASTKKKCETSGSCCATKGYAK